MSKVIRLVCSGVNMIQRHTDALLHYCLHARKNMTVFIIRPELHCFAYYFYSLACSSYIDLPRLTHPLLFLASFRRTFWLVLLLLMLYFIIICSL